MFTCAKASLLAWVSNSSEAEIEALDDGVKSLDKSVAEATEQSKDDDKDDAAAKESIEFAKNGLNKFDNPKRYKPSCRVFAEAEPSDSVFGLLLRMQKAEAAEQPREAAEARQAPDTATLCHSVNLVTSGAAPESPWAPGARPCGSG